jgi:ABC-type multidrug transport system fused ATPase/permease subunit
MLFLHGGLRIQIQRGDVQARKAIALKTNWEGWFSVLRSALQRQPAADRFTAHQVPDRPKGNLANLRPFAARHWRKMLLGALLILLAAALSFPQPMITRALIDRVILPGRISLLPGLLILLVSLGAAGKLMGLLQPFYLTRMQQEVILDIEREILERALRFPKAFFDANETGYLMARLSSDVQGLSWFFGGPLLQIPLHLLRFVGGLGFLFYLEWRLALGMLVLLPFIWLSVAYFSSRIHALSHVRREQDALLSGRFQEALASLPLIKAFSTEARTMHGLLGSLGKTLRLSLEASTINSAAGLAMNVLPEIAQLATLALGAVWAIQGQWTLGSLLAFQSYLGYVFGPARMLAGINLSLQEAKASLERVSALFDIVPEQNEEHGLKVERLAGEIEFRHVTFSYDGREPVLRELSFHARPGQMLAIVGPSGVGKTTLLSLILLFYRPTSGEILFDSRPASQYCLPALRRRIGYVSQKPQLLAGTFAENLRYGKPHASMEEVVRAARLAELHGFITSLPAGYDTQVGAAGVTLSEGQRQRLSLARALLIQPDILILDEPTAALDSATEERLLHNLPQVLQDKTLIVVAHRLSTIREADCILLLNESRLIASGNHHSLLADCAQYRELFSHQCL